MVGLLSSFAAEKMWSPPQGPVMGWTAWKSFHFEANETDVRAAADGLVSSGMHAAGYHTLSLDGGWWGGD